MSACLITFVKNPIPGAVKTRLQTRYTPQQATALYRAFVLDCLATYRSVPADRHVVAYDPPNAQAEIHRLVGPGWDLHPQAQTNLGDRMAEAFDWSFQEGATRTVLLGTDIPSLPTEHVRLAFRLLREKDLVLGPSADGGYYLIGLTRSFPEIFRDIDWSTQRVLTQTLDRVAGVPLGLIPPWYDVDTPDKLDILLAHAKALDQSGTPTALSHTRECLAAIAETRTSRSPQSRCPPQGG